MLAVNGIYDGEKVRITDNIDNENLSKKCKVVITFVEEIGEDDEALRNLSDQTTGMDFWYNEKEDVYQDYLPSNKQ